MEDLLNKLRTPIIFFCIGALFSAGLFYYFFFAKDDKYDKTSEITISSGESSVNSSSKIYIGGAVDKPGVYTIDGELAMEKVLSLINPLENADVDELKSVLESEEKVSSVLFVPYLITTDEQVQGEGDVSSDVTSCVNINTASASELDSLPGIGEAYAERIITGRPYNTKTDLKKVKGIGDKTYQNIETLICL